MKPSLRSCLLPFVSFAATVFLLIQATLLARVLLPQRFRWFWSASSEEEMVVLFLVFVLISFLIPSSKHHSFRSAAFRRWMDGWVDDGNNKTLCK